MVKTVNPDPITIRQEVEDLLYAIGMKAGSLSETELEFLEMELAMVERNMPHD